MNRISYKWIVLAIILIIVISVSAIVSSYVFINKTDPPFYVGVEFAYAYNSTAGMPSLMNDLKAMVDQVKDYTNLFVIGTPEISINQTALDEACDYINNSGLNFIILFTDSTKYHYANNYTPFNWIADAKQKYGDRFIGVFRFDEPGGNQLDNGISRMVSDALNYADAAANYTDAYIQHLGYWKNATKAADNGVQYVTADYGLYWFDYKSGYDTIFAEFGSNQSREIAVGLCRGAAQAQGKDWGTIITWEYNHPPYIESSQNLYSDLKLAYEVGSKYIIVFDYPKTGQYGILSQEHLEAIRAFWDYAQSNPQKYGSIKSNVAYVLPKAYGFGFRNPYDNIWGLWSADEFAPKIWNDTNKLITQYSSSLDIIYDDPDVAKQLAEHYKQLFFWNETLP